MSAQGHTPGPWRIGDAGNTVFGPKTDAPVAAVIAHMPKPSSRVTLEQRKANARLIAAAPDLLEACVNARAFMGEKPSDEKDSPYENGVRALIEQLEAAIAKATASQS